VMFDRRMRALYAARVCGSEVLADRPGALLGALGRHLLAAPVRMRQLARARRENEPPRRQGREDASQSQRT